MTLDPAKNHFDGPIGIPVLSEPDAEGFRTLEGYVPGYHVNATELGWQVADFTPFQVFPENHKQEFAGGCAYFLKFADEQAARAAIPEQFWQDDTP